MTPKIDQWMSDAAWEIYSATKKGEIKPDWIQKVIASHAPSPDPERAQEQQILFHHERASENAAQPTAEVIIPDATDYFSKDEIDNDH